MSLDPHRQAFPYTQETDAKGLTLCEYYAGHALAGLLAGLQGKKYKVEDVVAEAWAVAEDMCAGKPGSR